MGETVVLPIVITNYLYMYIYIYLYIYIYIYIYICVCVCNTSRIDKSCTLAAL